MCVFVGHSSGIVGMFSPRAVLPLCCLASKTLIDSRCNRERERLKWEYSKGGKNYTKWTKCEIKRGRDVSLLLASLKPSPDNSRETHKSHTLVFKRQSQPSPRRLLKMSQNELSAITWLYYTSNMFLWCVSLCKRVVGNTALDDLEITSFEQK